jgi:transposase InsO family protein
MTGRKDFFTRLQEGGVNLVIELEDDRRYKVQGIGIVSFQRKSGKPLRFVDVLYVLGLTKNLISISTLEDKGYEVTFRKGRVFIGPARSSEKMDKMIGIREEKVYRLQFQPGRALVSTTTDMGELWHKRMAHIHFGALRHLRQAVTGLHKFTAKRHDPCKGCAMGKYAKRPFPPTKHRSKGVLDLIHYDVCGPMSVELVSSFKYFVLFIDDYSRKTWIYFLKAKDESFDRFQEFGALVENQNGRKIRVLRFDNEGEYTSKEFVDYCIAAGIKKELIIPYNPQQNGVAERKNRTIVEAAWAMIHDQGLPLFLWAEASRIVVYIQNRSPHTVLGKLTLEEVFTGTKPIVSHFCIWGSVYYCHVPSEKRTELDPTAEKGILVGYSEASKAYRIIVPTHEKIIVYRDVQFEEEHALRRSRDLPTHSKD